MRTTLQRNVSTVNNPVSAAPAKPQSTATWQDPAPKLKDFSGSNLRQPWLKPRTLTVINVACVAGAIAAFGFFAVYGSPIFIFAGSIALVTPFFLTPWATWRNKKYVVEIHNLK